MEENKITAITKEKTDMLTEAYKDTLDILDAYDHQTLTRPEGTYYDGNETIEEVAVNMLYDMIKNPVWYDCDKQMAAIKFLLFLEWNNALFVNGEKRIFKSVGFKNKPKPLNDKSIINVYIDDKNNYLVNVYEIFE